MLGRPLVACHVAGERPCQQCCGIVAFWEVERSTWTELVGCNPGGMRHAVALE